MNYNVIAYYFNSPGLEDGSITVMVSANVPCTLSAGVLLTSVLVNSSGLVYAKQYGHKITTNETALT